MIVIDNNEAMRLLGIADYRITQMEKQIEMVTERYNQLNAEYNKVVKELDIARAELFVLEQQRPLNERRS